MCRSCPEISAPQKPDAALSAASGVGWEPQSYTLKDEPQPHVLFTLGFSNLNPAASSVST